MNGGDGAVRRINHEDRQAIRCADAEQHFGTIRNQCVSFADKTGLPPSYHHTRGVDLFQLNQACCVRPIARDACAEAVFQPLEFPKAGGEINVPMILCEQSCGSSAGRRRLQRIRRRSADTELAQAPVDPQLRQLLLHAVLR